VDDRAIIADIKHWYQSRPCAFKSMLAWLRRQRHPVSENRHLPAAITDGAGRDAIAVAHTGVIFAEVGIWRVEQHPLAIHWQFFIDTDPLHRQTSLCLETSVSGAQVKLFSKASAKAESGMKITESNGQQCFAAKDEELEGV
jgi:hypothetical protein